MNELATQILDRKSYDQKGLSEAYKNLINIFVNNFSFSQNNNINEVLGTILSYYKIDYDKKLFYTEDKKNFYEDINKFSKEYNLVWRYVNLKKNWYKDASGAYLARLKTGEFVALVPNAFGVYTYYNFDKKRRKLINNKNQSLFLNNAIMFHKAFPKKKLTIKDLFIYIKDLVPLWTYAELAIFNTIAVCIIVYLPSINEYLFNTIVPSKNIKVLISLFILAVSIVINYNVFDMIKRLVIEKNRLYIYSVVEIATMERIMTLPNNFFNKYSTGELTSIISILKNTLSTLFSSTIIALISFITAIVYIAQTHYYATDLYVPAALSLLFIGLMMCISSIVKIKYNKKILNLQAKFDGEEYAMLTGIQKIKLAGAEKRIYSKWLEFYTKLISNKCKQPFILTNNNVLVSIIMLIFTIIFEIYALKINVVVGSYYAFLSVYGLATSTITILIKSILDFAEMKPSFDIVKPILDTVPENIGNKPKVKSVDGNIHINKIKFRYNEEMPYVLDNFDLDIKSGEYVAIVGKTGCGKSTIIKLLLGFEKPNKGAIYYDNNDLQKVDISSIRENIGVVIQNGKLFTGDILSNIVVASKNPTEENAWEAAKLACLDEDIKEMPMGMHTMVSEGLGTISGGQKQRILIARALVNKPKIVILDEASSALDNITQKKVFDSIAELKCTRVVIAHRLSTIRHCDRIIYMEDGKVKESGNFEELIDKKGKFYEMLQNDSVVSKDLV